MEREDLIKIAKETIEITKKGYYYKNRKKIYLPEENYAETKVYDRKKLTDIIDDVNDYFEHFYSPETNSIYIVNADSFEAAKEYHRPLVMNFANAYHPGGGFLHGARAQEESLCRTSTLFASLTSKNAAEMYEYNNAHVNPLGSDCMLLSPNVCVFRDRHCNMLENPYTVSVFTAAAVDKSGMAYDTPQEDIDYAMTERIRLFLTAAARNSYENIILGAWGCGAFGNDAKTVAGYFKKLLIDEKMIEFFETVTFAILDNGKSGNFDAFKEVFGSTSIEYGKDLSDKYYTQAAYPMPVCNHNELADEHNIGYAQGIFSDGVPFEAELWYNDDNSLNLSVYIPDFDDIEEWANSEPTEDVSENTDENTIVTNSLPFTVCSIMCIGMVERDADKTLQAETCYVNYLVYQGILNFTTPVYNQIVRYLTDTDGNDLVEIIVTLKEDGNEIAETNLQFHSFPNSHKKSHIKIVK